MPLPTSRFLSSDPYGSRLMNPMEAYKRDPNPTRSVAGNTNWNWNTGGGYRGVQQGNTIGSAAGAVGSAGTPTSQRGRYEKAGGGAAGTAAAEMPSWMASQKMREAGGLSQDWRYGGFGSLPYADGPTFGVQGANGAAPTPQQPFNSAMHNDLMQEAEDFQAVQQPVPVNAPPWKNVSPWKSPSMQNKWWNPFNL